MSSAAASTTNPPKATAHQKAVLEASDVLIDSVNGAQNIRPAPTGKHGISIDASDALAFQQLRKLTKQNAGRKLYILDIGMGHGAFMKTVVPLLKKDEAHYTGLDLKLPFESSPLLKESIELVEGNILDPKILSGRKFDYIYLGLVLHFIPHQKLPALVDALARLINVGGLVFFRNCPVDLMIHGRQGGAAKPRVTKNTIYNACTIPAIPQSLPETADFLAKHAENPENALALLDLAEHFPEKIYHTPPPELIKAMTTPRYDFFNCYGISQRVLIAPAKFQHIEEEAEEEKDTYPIKTDRVLFTPLSQ